MHSEVIPGLYDQMNKIAQHISGYHLKASEVVPKIVDALNVLGFRNFAAMTVNNFNVVQRTSSSFAPVEKFFGRDLAQVIEMSVIDEAHRTGAPVFYPCGLTLHAPFEQVYNRELDQRYFGLFSVYRDQFTQGFVVIFGNDVESLKNMKWRLQAIAQLAVEATVKLPVKRADAVALTEDEIRILAVTYENKTATEVAEIVQMKLRTVNYNIARAIEKLGAVNKNHAAKLAKEMGMF